MATRFLVSEIVCACGHPKARHFVGWNVQKPAACMTPLCECRLFVQKARERGK